MTPTPAAPDSSDKSYVKTVVRMPGNKFLLDTLSSVYLYIYDSVNSDSIY